MRDWEPAKTAVVLLEGCALLNNFTRRRELSASDGEQIIAMGEELADRQHRYAHDRRVRADLDVPLVSEWFANVRSLTQAIKSELARRTP